MKYFCQFIIYTCLTSAYLSLLMAVSFYQLLSSKKPKLHMNKKEYPTVFIMSILAFVEGLLFAYFCWELCQEQLESLEDNQSYVDELKK